MEAIKVIEQVLKSLGKPFGRIYLEGSKAHPAFFVYQLVSGIESLFADDDQVEGSEYTFRVDLYARIDYEETLFAAIVAFKSSDFYGIILGPEMYDSGTGYYRMPIEVKYFLEVE